MKNIIILSYDGQRETGKVESQRKDLHLNVSIVQFSVSLNENLINGSFIEVK